MKFSFTSQPVLFLLAFVLGVIASYAMAPSNIAPAMLLGLGGLYYVISRLNNKPFFAGLAGWLFGFGFFGLSLIWIGNALLVEGNPYQWAWPLAVCALPAMLAFFPALSCAFISRFSQLNSWRGFMLFVSALGISEWLRGNILSGFPWNLYGYAWGESLPMLQILSISDTYALTALTIFWGASLGFLITSAGQKTKIIIISLSLVSMAAVYSFGFVRLQQERPGARNDMVIKIVQPNIPQSEKWDHNKMRDHFEKLLMLSKAQGNEPQTTLILWPETAINYMFLDSNRAMDLMRAMLEAYKNNVYLITGILLKNPDKTNANSLVVIDKSAEVIARYDKSHLVPFGEYIPLQKWIPLKTVSGFSGFVSGSGNATLKIGSDFSFSPLVCYEILFPGSTVDPLEPPQAILNVTNDSWYGVSAGPFQHFQKARFRAIEEQLPVIRSANTGISGAINAYGEVIQSAALNQEKVITVYMPLKKNSHGSTQLRVFTTLMVLIIGVALSLYKNPALFD
jgi:apolipoprotein N-acyltransferase